MEEYQRRIVVEYAELAEKRTKLNSFLGCTASAQIERVHRDLLEEQIDVMDRYAAILAERLKAMGIDLRDELIEAATTHCPARAVALIGELHPKNDDAMYRQAVQEIVANVR